MKTTETIAGIPEEFKAQLRQTLDDLVKGIHHPNKRKAACERLDRMHEDNRKHLGESPMRHHRNRDTSYPFRPAFNPCAWRRDTDSRGH